MEREELEAWLRLTLTTGVGSDGARRLLAAFGLPQAIFGQSSTALRQVVSSAQASALLERPTELDAQLGITLDWLAGGSAKAQRRLLTLGDPDYPQALLQTEDPPCVLYAIGRTALPVLHWPTRALAVVGSRNPTPQGALNARQFAQALSAAGVCIVSGLALGVDGAAHEGALQGNPADAETLATIAVVGTGLDRVYPKQHLALAHRIAERGLLLSEYPLGTPPLAHNFPRRNRLIAGLSQGTLVVEAALQSGSLITARLASEQGKEVFAIPGSIHSPQSRGCHALIRQGAKLVETAGDMLEELPGWSTARAVGGTGEPAARHASEQPQPSSGDLVLEALGADPVGLDALLARTGLDTATLQARLLTLELDGQLARLPGGLFQRIAFG